MSRVSREEMESKTRPVRVPVNEAQRNKLVVHGLDHDNFAYRWVNDIDDRLAMFSAGGWEFVDKNGAPVGDADGSEKSAGTSSKFSKGVGRAVTAHLMRIPKEFYLQDQKAKAKTIEETEAEIKRDVKNVGDYGKVEVSVRNT